MVGFNLGVVDHLTKHICDSEAVHARGLDGDFACSGVREEADLKTLLVDSCVTEVKRHGGLQGTEDGIGMIDDALFGY